MRDYKFNEYERAYWARVTPPEYEDDGELLRGDEIVESLREFTEQGGKLTDEQIDTIFKLLGEHA